MNSASRTRLLATGALVCFIGALLGLVTLHILRPDYEVSSHMISDYAVGEFGWLMVGVFTIWGAGVFMFSCALLQSGPSTIARKAGALLLGITSIGLLVSAAYPTDLPGTPDTPEGDIHSFSFLVNISCLLVAIPVLSLGFRDRPAWKRFRPVAVALAILFGLAFLLQFLTLRKGMPYGLTNRFFVITLFSWFICTALVMRSPHFHQSQTLEA